MAGHANTKLWDDAFAAFGAGDLDGFLGMLTPDAVWHIPGNHQLAGDHKGPGEIGALLGKLMQLTGGTLKIDIHDVSATDDHLIVMARVEATVNGTSGGFNEVHVWHVEGGKLGDRWTAFFNPQDIEDLFG